MSRRFVTSRASTTSRACDPDLLLEARQQIRLIDRRLELPDQITHPADQRRTIVRRTW